MTKQRKPMTKFERLFSLLFTPFMFVFIAGFYFGGNYWKAKKLNDSHVIFMADDSEAYVHGYIDNVTTKLITRWLQRNPKGELTIWFDSFGGFGEDAVKMADKIRSRGHIETIASNDCYSACTILWLAGSKRTVLDDVTLGFHGAFPGGTFASVDTDSECQLPFFSYQFLSLSVIDKTQELLLLEQEPNMASILLPMKPYDLHNGNYVALTKHGEGWTVRYHLSYYSKKKGDIFNWKPTHPKLLKSNQLSTYDKH